MTDVGQPGDPRRGVRERLLAARREPGLRREADVMGFTVCVAMLAALMVGNDGDPHSRLDVLAVVWATTLGLALTHWFAVLLSARLVRDPKFTHTPGDLLVSQLAMAAVVTTVATVAVLVTPEEFDRLVARVTAAVSLACLVGVESRASGLTWPRAAGFAAAALAIGVGIATVKWLISR